MKERNWCDLIHQGSDILEHYCEENLIIIRGHEYHSPKIHQSIIGNAIIKLFTYIYWMIIEVMTFQYHHNSQSMDSFGLNFSLRKRGIVAPLLQYHPYNENIEIFVFEPLKNVFNSKSSSWILHTWKTESYCVTTSSISSISWEYWDLCLWAPKECVQY